MSEHSAHLISLPFGFRTWLWRYTCLLLLILMLWHRQAIFESKGDEVAFLCRMHSNLEVSRHLFASRLNTHSQTDWAIEDQAKNLNSTVRWWVSIQPTWLHCRLAFAPDFDDILVFTDTHTHAHAPHTTPHKHNTHTHHTHTMLRHRQAIFCFHTHTQCCGTDKQFSNQRGHIFHCQLQVPTPWSLEPNLQQTEYPLPNHLSYWGSNKNLNSTACPYGQRAFIWLDPTAVWLSHLALAIYMFVIVNFDILAQAHNPTYHMRSL